jgi:hypothetical protein
MGESIRIEPLEPRRLLAGELGTVAYWRFENGTADDPASGDGTIADASVNGLNGTPVGGPPYRADVAGPATPLGAPNALSLDIDGVSQGVIIEDRPALALTHSLTLEALIKVRSTRAPGAGTQKIIMRGDDRAGLDPYQLVIVDNSVVFSISDDTGAVASVGAPLPALNQWLHVAGTLNGASGVMQLLFNGVLQQATTTRVRPFGTLDPALHPGVGIGSLQTTALADREQFNGLIDEVRISDRPLASSELLVPAGLRPGATADAPTVLVGQWNGTYLNKTQRIGGLARVSVWSEDAARINADLSFEAATTYVAAPGTFKVKGARGLAVRFAPSGLQGPATIRATLKYGRVREPNARKKVWRIDHDRLTGTYSIIEGGRRSRGIIALERTDTDGVVSV